MHSKAYAKLMQSCRSRLPAQTVGALLGHVSHLGDEMWITAKEPVPMSSVTTEGGLAPDNGEWERLKLRTGADDEGSHIIGLFYADSDIGRFPPRLDIAHTHKLLDSTADLLLLVNPSLDQGAFCVWRDGGYKAVGGYYEALPDHAPSVIPWTEDWENALQGAQKWLEAAAHAAPQRAAVTGRSGRVQRHNRAMSDTDDAIKSDNASTLHEAVEEASPTQNGVRGFDSDREQVAEPETVIEVAAASRYEQREQVETLPDGTGVPAEERQDIAIEPVDQSAGANGDTLAEVVMASEPEPSLSGEREIAARRVIMEKPTYAEEGALAELAQGVGSEKREEAIEGSGTQIETPPVAIYRPAGVADDTKGAEAEEAESESAPDELGTPVFVPPVTQPWVDLTTPTMDAAASEHMAMAAGRLEQQGDRQGALFTYAQALSLAPPGSELQQDLSATISRLRVEIEPDKRAGSKEDVAAPVRVSGAMPLPVSMKGAATEAQGRFTPSEPVQATPVEEMELAKLFDTALLAFIRSDLEQARSLLKEIVRHTPDYARDNRRAADLLAEIEKKLEAQRPKEDKRKEKRERKEERLKEKKQVTEARSSERPTLLRGAMPQQPLPRPATPAVYKPPRSSRLPRMDTIVLMLGLAGVLGTLAVAFVIPGPWNRLALFQSGVTPVAQALPPLGEPPMALPTGTAYLFPETGKTVSSVFLQYWQANGGLAQHGLPLSEVLGEVSELDGKPYTMQYFERSVFEYHPENPAASNVLLSKLGTLRYEKKYPDGAPDQKPNRGAVSELFTKTGRWVGNPFLRFWQTHSGDRLIGLPISDEFTELNDLDGKPYTVQYFEQGVLEYHPENPPETQVLLAQLGTLRYKEKYGR